MGIIGLLIVVVIIVVIIVFIVNQRSGNNYENDVVISEGKTCEAVRAGENNLDPMFVISKDS